MNLYLIRHSISEKIIPPKKDFERELTKEGIELIYKAANHWKKIVPAFDLILYSPYLRAEQSAKIIAEIFRNEDKLLKENNIAAGCSTGTLIDILSNYENEHIAVVGHQPDLSQHISNLCSGSFISLSFPPAAIAKISFERQLKFSSGRLEFLIPAEAY
ncbi:MULTISPECIES: phosphohistidine phosphatase SixA [Ignavibacterium]|jgi:phosphohistidine phosphatase|uniref:phosphohistidine phosphatase SixA n=1 Tax=Ignavibacterium TaxID=795750 RepID=UPI0025BFE8CF|nr:MULTISPECIES: phosphohistidine phosphatase SixA [Ignavibacterium]MBI5662088.1 phosphohistidine phosphatase SixA [Ignavibacterium album]